MQKKIYFSLIILSILGFITSLYLTIEHYIAGKKPCDITPTISCSLVNSSIYSEILGVPIAIFGMLWFIALFVLAHNSYTHKNKSAAQRLIYWNLGGLGFVIYLVIAEILLGAICPTCTVVHLIVLSSLGLSVYCYKKGDFIDEQENELTAASQDKKD